MFIFKSYLILLLKLSFRLRNPMLRFHGKSVHLSRVLDSECIKRILLFLLQDFDFKLIALGHQNALHVRQNLKLDAQLSGLAVHGRESLFFRPSPLLGSDALLRFFSNPRSFQFSS